MEEPFRIVISDFDLGAAIDGSEFCELLIKSGLYSYDSSITKVFAHSATLNNEVKQKLIKAGVDEDDIYPKTDPKTSKTSIINIIEKIIDMIRI